MHDLLYTVQHLVLQKMLVPSIINKQNNMKTTFFKIKKTTLPTSELEHT